MKNFEIEITKKPQLINLNDSEKNFEIKFKVVSENEEEFLAIVVNKEDLDKYSDLDEVEMKKSPGIIKGTLQCNEDKTENYFLVVKKEGEPCKASVEIDLNEIEKFEEIDQFASSQQHQQQPVKDNSVAVIFNKYFYHILGFLIVVSLIYYFYSKKITIKSIPAALTDKSSVSTTSVSAPLSQSPSVSAPLSQTTVPTPSVPAPLSQSTVPGGPSATPTSSIELGEMSPSLQSGLTILDKLATSPNC